MTVEFGSTSSIKGLDEMLRCESLPLIRVPSIEDGALIFCHLTREEEALGNRVHPIVNRCLRCHHTSIEVHREHLISVVITLQMNG